MADLYFAYGSNLKLTRLRGRVPSAHPLGPARLPGFRLTCDKRGADGSGKANLWIDGDAEVWGALYRLDPAEWPALDACETRYERIRVHVLRDSGGEHLEAETYLSRVLTPDPVPFDWYRRLILEGAREHGLPAPWLRHLEGLPERATRPALR